MPAQVRRHGGCAVEGLARLPHHVRRTGTARWARSTGSGAEAPDQRVDRPVGGYSPSLLAEGTAPLAGPSSARCALRP
ncbi:hypothetical protein FTX61_14635 [Nitriliruptoraceae bacterium ZYF776]|nr:hypothetical protein [Profundirhabdus halotolerans]